MTATISSQSPLKTHNLTSPHFGPINPSTLFEKIFYSLISGSLSITKWIRETLLKFLDRKPNHISHSDEFKPYLNHLVTSVDEPICKFSDEVPTWFDVEKFAQGRAFAMRHILGLLYAEELALILLMAMPMLRRPLVFSGQSNTADKAFQRYLSTIERVMSWYAQDIWDKDSKAYHNLMVVRGMHKRVDYDMKNAAEVAKTVQLFDSITTPFLKHLRADLESYLPDAQHRMWLDIFQCNTGPYMNQAGMAFTQVSFVALVILEPRKFGASRATQGDLENFVYVWYVLGHQLGLADRYNICTGGLEATRQRCKLILSHLVLPSLALAGADWEHMSRCVVAAVHRMIRQTSFEASFAYSLWVLNVPTPHINTLITWTQLPRLWLFKCVLCLLLSIPGMAEIFGNLLKLRLDRLRRRLDIKTL